jgi:hypothetical protein
MKPGKRSLVAVVVALVAVLALIGAASAQDPTVPSGPRTLPDYIGAPAKAHSLAKSGVPQDPYLAPNPYSHAHNDSWNSDTVGIAAPRGRDPEVLSSTLASVRQYPGDPLFNCGTMAIDGHGRPLLTCMSWHEALVVLADKDTLQGLAAYPIPLPTNRLNALGAFYFYLDNSDRFVIATYPDQVYILAEGGTDANPTLEKVGGYDLSESIPDGDNIAGVMADWQGRLWFSVAGAGAEPAQICVLNPAHYTATDSGAKCVQFGKDKKGNNELIRNTFALTEDGAYVVSSQKMYGIAAGSDDQPYVMWSEPYKTIGKVKLGQYSLGSGTSPTIVGEGKYVGITDNDDQLHVVVYRTAARLGPKEKRVVCEFPVFKKGAGADENSLVGYDLSFLAENNYGYEFDFSTGEMKPNKPGFARVDIDPDGKGCSLGWKNDEIASSVSGHLSTKTGLYYTLSRKMDKKLKDKAHPYGLDEYYWTALDWRTGKVVWEKWAGTGTWYDGWYPGLGIGPNGTMYVGEYGGLLAIRDTH